MKDNKTIFYVCPNCNSTFNYFPSECQFCGRISKTNADRIRAMSDDDKLAREIFNGLHKDGDHIPFASFLRWLKQEVE